MPYFIRYSGMSHIGHRRQENQDSFVCKEYMSKPGSPISQVISGTVHTKDNAIFGVFDGMGGLPCGGDAAQIAAEGAATLKISNDPVVSLFDYCNSVNEEICSFGVSKGLPGIGTTAALLAFTPKKIALCNIGDTKIFWISRGRMEQISKDHVFRHPGDRPYLTHYLGLTNKASPMPYLAKGSYQRGDRYLICSDGLTDMIPVEEIRQTVCKNSIQLAVPKLIHSALAQGGKDNITIILCSIGYRLF